MVRGIFPYSFKPYYKWNTFNTEKGLNKKAYISHVCFKPYYKWNTFNTEGYHIPLNLTNLVLNLIINGIPSIPLICIRILILW